MFLGDLCAVSRPLLANLLKQHFNGQTLPGNIHFSESLVIKSPQFFWDLLESAGSAELQGRRALGSVAKSPSRLAACSASAPAPLCSWQQQFGLLRVGLGRFLTAFW